MYVLYLNVLEFIVCILACTLMGYILDDQQQL